MATTAILTVDETSGVQNNQGTLTSNDTSAPIPTRFQDALAAVGVTVGSSTSTALSGVDGTSTNAGGQSIMTFGAGVSDVGFTDSAGLALNGTDSLLTTDDGTHILLYTSTTDNNVVFGRAGVGGPIVFALYLDTGVTTGPGDAGATSAKLWLTLFQPIHHPDVNDPNDIQYLQNLLYVNVNTLSSFSAEGAPSGQNVFLMLGDGSPAAGENTVLVTGASAADTVNTGQGGGSTTIGSNNQMVDPGEGMYFTFVKGADPGLTVPNLSAGEAGQQSNMQFSSYVQSRGGDFTVVQLQPTKQATLLLTAINETDTSESGTSYFAGLHDGDESSVDITKIVIDRLVTKGNKTTTQHMEFTSNSTQNGVTVDFTGLTAKITGVIAGDKITYQTSSDHDRLFIQNVGTEAGLNSAFDIGGFELTSGSLSATALGPIGFVDDGPSATLVQQTATVDEDGLTGGIAGGIGDVPGEVTTVTGSVSALFTSGADQPATFGLSTTTTGLPSLSSGGTALVYSVSGATLTATAGAGGATVFTFTITNTSTGAYSFTLSQPLDHPTLDNQTGDNTENNLTIDLSSVIKITDKDGDSVTASPSALVVTVNDDTPAPTTNQVTATVDEDGLTGGHDGGTGDVTGTATSATGNISTLFNAGADGLASYGLSTVTTGLPALTSGGVALVYGVSGNTLTATAGAGGATVFTFSITNALTGAYSFTLSAPLDHPTLNGITGDDTENNLLIDLSSIIQATDKDGDSTTAAANALVVTVNDDTPIAFTPAGLTLTNTGTDVGSAALNDGSAWGADGPGSIVFVDTVVADDYLRSTTSTLLKSGGENIVLSGYGTGTLTATTETTHLTVFTATLDNPATGQYTIDFDRKIDDGAAINFLGAAPVKSGNPTYNIIDNVGNTTLDLLFSGGDVNGGLPTAHSVNVSTQGAGTDNQSMNPGETLRIDFDVGASLAGSPLGSDFNPGTHQNVNGFSFLITQNTNAGTNGTAFVKVFDADNDKVLVGDSGDVPDTINKILINGQVLVDGTTVTPRTVNGQSVNAISTNGGWVITNLNEGQTGDGAGGDDPAIKVFTSSGFNRVEVSNYSGVTVNGSVLGGTSFDMAPAGVDQAVQGTQFNFQLPVQMTDYDSDRGPVETIGVTVNPVPLV